MTRNKPYVSGRQANELIAAGRTRNGTLMQHSTFSMPAHEGAAIYYERIAEDLHRALEVVDRALERLEDKTPDAALA